MKNLLIAFILILPLFLQAQSSVYQVHFKTLEQKQVSLSEYKGKKIIIAVCSAKEPRISKILALDSLLKKNSNTLAVIIAPLKNWGEEDAVKGNLRKILLDSLKVTCTVMQPVSGKKGDGQNQHSLLKWLTDKNSNIHFDNDVVSPDDIFVISEKGKLFAVLQNQRVLNAVLIKRVLDTKVPEN